MAPDHAHLVHIHPHWSHVHLRRLGSQGHHFQRLMLSISRFFFFSPSGSVILGSENFDLSLSCKENSLRVQYGSEFLRSSGVPGLESWHCRKSEVWKLCSSLSSLSKLFGHCNSLMSLSLVFLIGILELIITPSLYPHKISIGHMYAASPVSYKISESKSLLHPP